MREYNFTPQSKYWAAYRVVIDDTVLITGDRVVGVQLAKRESGKLTEYIVTQGGIWCGEGVAFSGEVVVSNASQNDAIIALASSGSWSGGSNYKGFVFGKPGAVICFDCKGKREWWIFGGGGIEKTGIKPGTVPVQL